MKKLILKWLGIDHLVDVREKLDELKTEHNLDWAELSGYSVKHRSAIDDLQKKQRELEYSMVNRIQETSGIIETLQNLDNHEVIRDLNDRIKKLEEQR